MHIFVLAIFSLLPPTAQKGQNSGQHLGGTALLYLPIEGKESFWDFLLIQKNGKHPSHDKKLSTGARPLGQILFPPPSGRIGWHLICRQWLSYPSIYDFGLIPVLKVIHFSSDGKNGRTAKQVRKGKASASCRRQSLLNALQHALPKFSSSPPFCCHGLGKGGGSAKQTLLCLRIP